MTEYEIYPLLDAATHPPISLKEHIKHCMSLYLRLKEDLVKALNVFCFFFFLSLFQDHLLSPKMLSQHHLSCFVSS